MCESKSNKEIVDIILGWSIDDITNKDLSKDKVGLIPTEFSYVNHYLESFCYPLIEEARSVLSTCLFAVSDAPFVGMIVERCNVSEGFTNDGNNIFSFSLYNGERRGHYEPKVGDIVLLSTSVPKDYEEIRQGIRPSCLAVVDLIGNGNGKQWGKLGKFGSEEIKGGGSSYVAIYLMNFTETSHIRTTLNVDTTDPHLNLNLIKKALCRKSLDLESCSCTWTSFQTEDILHEKIVSKLNESQIDAVRFLVSPIRCNHSLSMRCISGLPGTGKSEIACITALAALNLKCRVILCVPAKFSVVDIASHFVKIVNRCHGGYNLKDIVVFGENSEEHYKNTGDLAFIRPDILNMLKHGRRIPNTTEKQCNRLFCLDKSPLIFCSVARLLSLKGCGSVAVLIMDNADLIKEWESVLPLQLKGLRHVLLMGNDYEFQRTFKSQISEAVGFARSLFTRVGSLCPPKKLIDIQYRMHHGISCFPSKRLFSGQLLNDPDDISRIRFNCQLPEHIYKAYSFIDFADGKEISNDHGEDWKNIVEAAVVIKILTKLFRARVNSGGKLSIGVISPYKAQVQLIQEMLSDRIESNSEISLWVRSSDEIQSCEVDVIIISTVRCNESGSVGLLSDRYLTSASLTRARSLLSPFIFFYVRHCLWILGNRSTLVKSHSIWKDLVVDAEERGCIFHAGEDKDLAAVILDVKRELDELNDLLNQESVLFNHKKWKMIFSDDFKRSFVALKTLFIKQIVLGFLLKLAGDIATESKFIQVLKIWDVLPLVEIPNVVVKLEKMTYLFSDYYMKRCMEQKYEGILVVPMSWNICSDFVKYKCAASLPDLENSKVNESLLLMKFYSLSSVSVKNLLKACDGREIELPFEVSDLELEIVKCPRSAFVLGRSGTGKTIISIMRLMKREQEFVEALHGTVPFNWFSYHNKRCENNAVAGYGLRQIFITVSVNLCSGVKDYINRLKRCIFGMEIQAGSSDGEMWELGDSLSMFSDIPDSFTNMPQRHFPIVVSLRKFLLMLDGSLSRSFFNRFKDLKVIFDGQRSTMTHAQQQIILGKEVRFERFLTSYWPSFKAKYTRKLDPLLVYTQIISFIKGGCRLGVADPNEKMSEEDYIKLSNNLVIDIQRRLRFEGYGGPMMDFVYIDEVQDFTLNQLSLLKYICSNTFMLDQKGHQIFKLKQNFRTHSSVLNLAQSVLTLLYHFFPESVDKLESETSLVHGELPVLLQSCDQNVLKNIFHSNVGNSNGAITFGAQQVILDVLLYNFFEKAPLEPGWEKLGVVKLGELDFSFGSGMVDFCKLEEWNLRGQKFFNKGNYEAALLCFKRSGDVSTRNGHRLHLFKWKEKTSGTKILKWLQPVFLMLRSCSLSNAARNYAQGKCLSKCLSSCKRVDLFELGWAFIKKWSGQVPTDTKVNFLKSWISKINKLSDIVSVVEIARTFPEDAYSFLIENENYVEASKLQRIRGNTILSILEAYMLERAEVYKKSSQLVDFHIAVQIISTDERSGWSMQHAHNLENLLDGAKELAYRVSKSYGDEVRAELAFLSDRNYSFKTIRAHFQRAQNQNVMVETFAAHKKADIGRYDDDSDAVFKWRSMHFEKVVFEGHFSSQVLINIWNTWKQRISCLFSYLQGSVNTSQYKIYKDLCHKCFGVLKLNSKDVFLAFNSQASWLKGANEESLHRFDEKVYISGPVFRSLAQQFLRTQVSFVCDKLLGILTQLQMNYQEKRFCFVQ
ncbi:hypothetical protein IFM89_006041 [Coptis chinensis]|uniref:DNA2/NAM7 helicase-like C-terminal domain-containing protein n=1 Tax=Coptis chinensis TaxID=261450 RepID=A0A835HZW3_9MAGN|nr:hypothetical protein IFM89_006041 [Coptis chinensis]